MLGRTLSHYEILDTLGAGGMGEVYRARDTKLGREVAIKVLPEEFSRDRERLDRFEREAKLLAALNHPNVATLYGLEVSDGQSFLVMELVEGETLAERIARGNLPLDEAVSIFMQIADGLEAAHEKGIIHRDLKPANIKITPDGQVKILDFGLAKAFVQDDETDPSSSQSPTLTRGTALGTIMGTVAYMSPEQARAKQVDKRADIWAFGICLFEALSGTRLFEGDGATDILGSILKLDPNWDALPLELPSSVQRLLRRCLQKDARRRLRDIGDARHDLEERSNDTESGSPSIPNRARQVIPWILVAAMVGLLLRGTGPSPERATRRFPIDLPWQTVSNWGDFRVAISPDGTHLAYHGRHENRVEIYLRPLDSLEALPISGPVSPQSVAFSPDGKRLAFESAGELRTVSIQGGQPDSVLQVPEFVEGLSWGADDNILIGGTDGLSKVSASGGDRVPVTRVQDADTQTHGDPSHLPGGAHALFTIFRPEDSRLAVADLVAGTWNELSLRGTAPLYSPSGHLLFRQGNELWAAPFDLDELELTSEPVFVLDGIAYGPRLANDGTLAYVAMRADGDARLVWVDRNGQPTAIRGERRDYSHIDLSTDGKYALLNVRNIAGPSSVYVSDLARGNA